MTYKIGYRIRSEDGVYRTWSMLDADQKTQTKEYFKLVPMNELYLSQDFLLDWRDPDKDLCRLADNPLEVIEGDPDKDNLAYLICKTNQNNTLDPIEYKVLVTSPNRLVYVKCDEPD